MIRKLFAFIIAPLPVALFQSIVVGIWPKPGHGIFEHPASMFVAISLYFYVFGLLIGLPLWLSARGRSQPRLALPIIGIAVGTLPVGFALLYLSLTSGPSATVVIYNLALFGLGGWIAGRLFCRLAEPRAGHQDVAVTFS